MNGTRAASPLGALRHEIARLERRHGPVRTAAALSSGVAEIDRVLPGGGLAQAALHDLAGIGPEVEHGSAAALVAASVLSRRPGPVIWVLNRRDLFAPALSLGGLDLDRVVFVEAGKQVLLAMEDALQAKALAGVVGEIGGRVTLTASRRLQLAAEASGVTALMLRRSRRFDDPTLAEPCAATTRWRIACLPAGPPIPHAPHVPGCGPARWRLDLVRCRGGEPRSWVVEAGDAAGGLNLVSDLGDGQAAPPRLRAAG